MSCDNCLFYAKKFWEALKYNTYGFAQHHIIGVMVYIYRLAILM